MTAVHKNKIDEFHEHLNKQNTSIQFTKEIKENGEIPFLDCLVTRENNTLRTTIYRKPTYTDRLLDQTSYNPTSHKAATVRTLTRRAQIVCDSHYSLTDETKHLNTVFIKNNYSTDFIKRNAYVRPNDSSDNSYTTTATVPYIRGTSETIAHILRPYNIRVAHKPMFTLRRLLTNVKDKDEPEDRPGADHKIKWSDCQATYIGETGRNLTTRLNEHKRATKKGDVNNDIAEHHLKTSQTIDWDSATCLTYSTDYYQRITLESWFTNLEQTALNRCQPLPAPYKRLLNRKQLHVVYYSYYNPSVCITISAHFFTANHITQSPTATLSIDQSNRSPGFLNFQPTKTITWLWRWLPHRLSKRQSLTTVLLRTPITHMIFFNQGMLLLGSNHFLI